MPVVVKTLFCILVAVGVDRGVPMRAWAILGKDMSREDYGVYMRRYGWFKFPRYLFAILAVMLVGISEIMHSKNLAIAAVLSLMVQGGFSVVHALNARR